MLWGMDIFGALLWGKGWESVLVGVLIRIFLILKKEPRIFPPLIQTLSTTLCMDQHSDVVDFLLEGGTRFNFLSYLLARVNHCSVVSPSELFSDRRI